MSILTPDLTTDIEFDIEKELDAGDESHALPFCHKHKTRQFFPVAGTIVQAICGKIFRVGYLKPTAEKAKCSKCSKHHGKLKCHYCGVEVHG